MDKSTNINQRTEPPAPKLQQWIDDPIDRAAAKVQRATQVLELMKTKFKPEDISDILTEDDECVVFLRNGKRYHAYLTLDRSLYLKQW